MTRLLLLFALRTVAPVQAAGSGDPPAATGQPAPPAGDAPVPPVQGGHSPRNSAPAARNAALHGLSTHDLTYWGLPLGQSLVALLSGVGLHKRAVKVQAGRFPNSDTGVIALWGASIVAHLLCAVPVVALFLYWASATGTTTANEFLKRAWVASGAEVAALVAPPLIWVALTLIAPTNLEGARRGVRGSTR